MPLSVCACLPVWIHGGEGGMEGKKKKKVHWGVEGGRGGENKTEQRGI